VGRPGGVIPPAEPLGVLAQQRRFSGDWSERLEQAAVVLVDGVNPAYNAPASQSALASAETVISFSPFLDDTSAFADLILPDHDPLEQAALEVPAVSPSPSIAAAGEFVAPLYDSRPIATALSELAEAAERPFEELTVGQAVSTLHSAVESAGSETSASDFEATTLRDGGWQGQPSGKPPATPGTLGTFEIAAKQEGEHEAEFHAFHWHLPNTALRSHGLAIPSH